MWLKKTVCPLEILCELMGLSESLKKHNTKPIRFSSKRYITKTLKTFILIHFSILLFCPDAFILSIKMNVRIMTSCRIFCLRHSAVIMLWVLLLLLQPCHLKFLFCFPPFHCKPETSGGKPHKLLSSVSALPSFSASCLHATTTH